MMVGIPVVCAIGAPSSLAVELAQRSNMTIIGFIKPHSFNIYSADWRVKMDGLAAEHAKATEDGVER